MYGPHHDELGGAGGARLALGCGLERALLQRGSHWIRPRPPCGGWVGRGRSKNVGFFYVC